MHQSRRSLAIAFTVASCLCLGPHVKGQQRPPTAVAIFDSAFSRTPGQPSIQTSLVVVPPIVHGPFTMTVRNGSDGMKRASSARITINRTVLFGPRDFNQTVGVLERNILMAPQNTLEVDLTSAPDTAVGVRITGFVDPDTITADAVLTATSEGGSLRLSDTAALYLPPGAVPSPTSVEMSSVSSPLMTFLSANLPGALTLLPAPQIRIKSDARFTLPVRLQVSISSLRSLIPSGSEVAFFALQRESGGDGEALDTLTPIGGVDCGDGTFACVTLLPEWFEAMNPADPNDPVLQIGIGFRTVSTGNLHLWEVPPDQVLPAPGSLTIDAGASLPVSARVQLTTNITAGLPVPLLQSTDIVSHFGPRAAPPGFHHGIDVAVTRGTPVSAVVGGVTGPAGTERDGVTVTCADGSQRSGGYGNRVWAFHGGDASLRTIYAHLSSIAVSEGDPLAASAQIGLSGSTGAACGPHLHLGMLLLDQYIDPEPLLPAVNDISRYLPYKLALSIDGVYIADLNGLMFDDVDTLDYSFSRNVSSQVISSLGSGQHVMTLEMSSVPLGVRSLQRWAVTVRPGRFTITVAQAGDGTGSIVSSPAGITCGGGATNCSATFDSGTNVVLSAIPTAIPISARSFFEAWSGCPGTASGSSSTGGSCEFTAHTSATIEGTFLPFRLVTAGESCSGGTAVGSYQVTGAVGSGIFPGGHPAPYATIACGVWTGPLCCLNGSDPSAGQYCVREQGQPATTVFSDSEPGGTLPFGQRYGGQNLVELIDRLGTGIWFVIRDHRSIGCPPS